MSLGGYATWSGRSKSRCPIPPREALTNATFYLSSLPIVDAAQLDSARKLRAVIELYGAFPDTVDYPACSRGASMCLPPVRECVARSRRWRSRWLFPGRAGLCRSTSSSAGGRKLAERQPADRLLALRAKYRIVGFGSIAKECCRLLAPFEPSVSVYDPWLDAKVADEFGTKMVTLEELAQRAVASSLPRRPQKRTGAGVQGDHRCVAEAALLVLVSRAHLIDFDALVAAAGEGRILASDRTFSLWSRYRKTIRREACQT